MTEFVSAKKGYAETFNNVSVLRLTAYAFERIWVLIIFYSTMFYTGSSDVNEVLELLYTNLSISLAVMGATLLLVGFILNLLRKAGFYPSQSTPFLFGSAMIMSAGALLLILSSLNTITGAMTLIISAALTGIGSGCMLHCFFESYSTIGSRTAILEMSIATAIALLISFLLITLPPLVADVVIVASPLAAAALLTCYKKNPAAVPKNNMQQKNPFSKRTKLFFGKALAGALVLGVIEGFYDSFFGFSPTAATLAYDSMLFAVSFLVVIIVAVVATAAPRDMLFHMYRIAMGLFAIACVLSVALGDNGMYASALFFAGYVCLTVLLTGICVEVSETYDINPPLLFGITFFVLYLGELIGANMSPVLLSAAGETFAVANCCIVCLFLLFAACVYLFNEADLVTIGIGELRTTVEHARAVRVSAGARAEGAGAGAGGVGAGGVGGGDAGAGGVGVGGATGALGVDTATATGATGVGAATAVGAVGAGAEEGTEAIESMSIQEAACAIASDYHLSARESEVLPLLLEGRTIGRIQDALFISAGTVSTHIRHIYQKTGVSRRQELIDLGQRYVSGITTNAHNTAENKANMRANMRANSTAFEESE